jgi:hypothetical protein
MTTTLGHHIETYEEWHTKTYGAEPDPWQPYLAWQVKFTAYIASKPKQFLNVDRVIAQELFDKATSGVINQGGPSYLGKNSFDSIASYFSYRKDKIFRCPVGYLLSDEQIVKYNIGPGRFICDWKEELIVELLPNSSVVCARHFISKLQRAHTRAYILFKKSKEQSDFIADFIAESNIVARHFGLKEI